MAFSSQLNTHSNQLASGLLFSLWCSNFHH